MHILRADNQKKQQIEDMIEKIHSLKTQVMAKYNEESDLREKVNGFTSQYQNYLSELNNQYENLLFEISTVRMQIQKNLQQDEVESVSEAEPIPFINENLPLNKPITDGGENTATSTSTLGKGIDMFTDTIDKDKKVNTKIMDGIRRHFALSWHPDKIKKEEKDDLDLMTVLNVSFDNSLDPADLLAAIPWNVAWEEPSPNETIGDQWSRFMDWLTYLEIASERLEQKIGQIKQDWRYPLFTEWENAKEKMDFFTVYASRKRDEIKSLEETLAVLLQQLGDS